MSLAGHEINKTTFQVLNYAITEDFISTAVKQYCAHHKTIPNIESESQFCKL